MNAINATNAARNERNVYAFQLDPAKLRRLVQEAPSAAAQLRMELVAFL